MPNNDYCSCGNPKYPDADSCEECHKKGSGYDRDPRDRNSCACGNPKYPDADSCEQCYNKQRPYIDK